ncbi:hypothetical protein [Roseibacillus ishigakijimensis]|uniref:Small-conductance mechanosensitive channel n=1 Tax=Roseibacillus ishigakijimensis TaxID=454146 RepID=A0A934RNE8_9BACT|nr:hypothetical protein [Roseibacillus ishigakijimensis]MBK1832857.1 hypothetical protein [Roseibacillus ishigakijimensis]
MRAVACCFFLFAWSLQADSVTNGRTRETLETLSQVIADTSAELTRVRDLLSPEEGEEPLAQQEIERLQKREAELAARLEENEKGFGELATGVRADELTTADEADLDPMDEVREILQPAIKAVKEATARPREIEMLRSREARLLEQAELAKQALARLSRWQGLQGHAAEEVAELQEIWSSRQKDAEGQLAALAVQMDQQESEQGSILKPVSDALGNFFKGRGLNLLKAIGALAATWFLLRWLWRWLLRLPVLAKRDHGAFGWRLLELSAVVISGLLAAFASLMVLYYSGDWLLLTLFIVFIVGLGWTAKNTIPKTFEQTKMLLNLGPVRKGERLTFEGVPWEVGTIGIYTELRNCELTGGLIRMSIKRLSTLRSRPHEPSEAWFPTKTGDWVLAGGSLGKVVMQTPEYVQVVRLGGARETFPTADFLSMAPINLCNSFRVTVTFGIDYAHQSISTTKVVATMKAKLANRIVDLLEDREHLNSLNVEFASAAASSLDYSVLADFKGAAAPRYNKLERGIQSLCVDICNEEGWNIPFTQITLHQA